MILVYAPLPVLSETFNNVYDKYFYPLLYDEVLFHRYLEVSTFACGLQKLILLQKVKDIVKGFALAITTVVSYALLLLGTVVFVIVFKRSILKRKSLTTRKKQGDTAKEARLMLNVLVVCVIYLITAAPRTILRMADYFDFSFRHVNYYVFVDYALGYFQAVNHVFNIFVYLGINTQFRKTFCDIFMLKRTSKTKR